MALTTNANNRFVRSIRVSLQTAPPTSLPAANPAWRHRQRCAHPASSPRDPFRAEYPPGGGSPSQRPCGQPRCAGSPAIPVCCQVKRIAWFVQQQHFRPVHQGARIITRRFSPADISPTQRSRRYSAPSMASASMALARICSVTTRFGHKVELEKKPLTTASSPRVTEVRSPGSSVATTPRCLRSSCTSHRSRPYLSFPCLHERWDSTRKSWL